MSRPPLPIGTWGNISTRIEKTDGKGKPVTYLSKARIRDHDGHVRPVTAVGSTQTAAERNLLKKLQDRAKTNQSGALTAMHKLSHLIDLWEKKFEERIADGKRSPTSLGTYRRAIKNHIRPPSPNSASAKPPPNASTPQSPRSRTAPVPPPPKPAAPSCPA
jgi:hypothetical protein